MQAPRVISTLSYKHNMRDSRLLKHFTGLTSQQFEVLHNFLNDVCPLETTDYRTVKDCCGTENARTGLNSEFSSREKLYICLLRLKRGFTLETLSALLSILERSIDKSYVRKIFTTFI